MATKYITLKVTESELLAITDSIDTLSAIPIDDNGVKAKDIKKIDKMLLRNGFKREYN